MQNNIPKLYGLVLGGGKSTRMGSDKRLIQYHEVSQQIHTYNLLSEICDTAFLSVRDDQVGSSETGLNIIVDENKYRGPFNGILSAHAAHPEVAWLVLACDLPLIDKDSLEALVAQRNPDNHATSMATKKTNMPEPLVTIWEPKGLEKAKEYLESAESSCPRKFLLNSEVGQVHPLSDDVLFNANSQEDYEQIKKRLKAI